MLNLLPDQASNFLKDLSNILVDPNLFGSSVENMTAQPSYMDPKLRFFFQGL